MSDDPEKAAQEAFHRANWRRQALYWWEFRRGGRDKLTRADLLDMAAGLPPPPVTTDEWLESVRAKLPLGRLHPSR